MKRVLAIIVVCVCGLGALSLGQNGSDDTGKRKVVEKVQPAYPTVARNMHITGTVKVEATVNSNGSVKSVEIKGGHPMLAQAAADAVTKWRWAPSGHETLEPVQVSFGTD
jgi:TonB family protein